MDIFAIKYGFHKTVWKCHKKWSEKGVWKNIMDSLVSHGYHKGLVNVRYLIIFRVLFPPFTLSVTTMILEPV